MTDDSSDRFVLLNRLADEFAARYRRGERPPLQEYVDRHPELADDIRECFPALAEMEQVKDDRRGALAPPAPCPTARLDRLGDFRVIREVGRGGMGVVYEAEQVSLGRHVALKVLQHKLLVDARTRQRFEREARAAARLHHTNIVPVFGVGEYEGIPYYVMQFIPGLGLDEVLEEVNRLRASRAGSGSGPRPDGGEPPATPPAGAAAEVVHSFLTGRFTPAAGEEGEPGALPDATVDHAPGAAPQDAASKTRPAGRLSDTAGRSSSVALPGAGPARRPGRGRPTYWQSVARVGVQVAEALAYAHGEGVLHRDIKPSNLLLDMHGRVWVTDFGLAKADGQQDLTHTGDVLGTLRYMPPEAFDGKSDARGDVYSLGLTLYELLAFRPAFDEQDRPRLIKRVTTGEPAPLGKLNPEVPRDLETVVHKAIDRDPARRYATAEELAADLQRFLDDEPVRARRASPVERLVRWARHNRQVAALLAAIALILAGAAVAAGVAAARFHSVAAEKTALAQGQRQLAEEKEEERARAVEARNEADAARVREAGLRREAEAAQKLAEERAEVIGRNLYFAEMHLAAEAAEAAEGIGRVNELLAHWLPGRHPADRRGWEWYYLNGLGRRDLLTLRGHAAGVSAVAWSPDGKRLATGGEDGAVLVWDAVAGKQIAALRGHRSPVLAVAWSPDGKKIASGGQDATARVWDLETEKPLVVFRRHTHAVRCVCWGPAGDRVATGSGDWRTRVWDPATGEELLQLRGRHQNGVNALAWSPDGKQLATVGGDQTMKLSDPATGRLLRTVVASDDRFSAVAWAPDSKWFAFAGRESLIRLWDVQAGREADPLRGHNASVLGLAWGPDGRRLASAGGDRTVRLWDSGGRREVAVLRGHTEAVRAVDWSRGGLLATASGDGTVKVWDPDREQDPALRGHDGPVTSVAWTADGRLATGGWDGAVRLWDAAGRETARLEGHAGRVYGVAWAPGGKRLASVGDKKEARVWDPATGRATAQVASQPNRVYAAAWNRDGSLLATAGGDQSVRLVNPDNGQEVRTLRGHRHQVYAVSWSPDGKRLASGANDGTAIIWDPATGEPTATLAGHGGAVNGVGWSPDGRLVATAGADNTVKLWDAATGKETATLRGHTAEVLALHWSPDGARLATGGQDRAVKVWDAAAGQETATLRGHSGWVLAVSWSGDGRCLASAGKDGVVRLWDAAPGYAAAREPAPMQMEPAR